MRDLEKPRVILSCISASSGRTNQQQYPNTNWSKAQSWQSEVVTGSIKIQQYTEVTYLEAGRKHNIEQTLIWQQSKFCWGSRGIHTLWLFLMCVGFFKHSQNCETSSMLSLTCSIKSLRKRTGKDSRIIPSLIPTHEFSDWEMAHSSVRQFYISNSILSYKMTSIQ